MVSPILLVSFLITFLLASAVSRPDGVQINDTDGNPVKVGEQYIIRGVNGPGGVFPYNTGLNRPFPINIFQIPVNYPGDPVKFAVAPIYPPKTIVDTDSVVTIEFKICENCKESKYWGFDDSASRPNPAIFVGADPERINSWFQIRPAGENIYKFVTRSGKVEIVQAIPIGGQLLLTNDTGRTFSVKFEKVDLRMDNSGDATLGTRVEKLGRRMFPFY